MEIRRQQMESLEEQSAGNFVDRLTALVKAQNTGIPPGTSDRGLRRMVEHGVDKAKARGLTWESSIGKFVGLMFAIAPNFDSHPPVNEVLSDLKLPPDERVAELFRRVTPEQWQGAVQRYDMSAWPAES